MKRIVATILAIALLLSTIPSVILGVKAESAVSKIVGDVDRDGEITDWDGVMLARHLAGWSVGAVDEKILDIDGDGEVTDWDGVMFDRHLAGWSVVTQAGKSLTYSITYANTKGSVNTNPTAYESGSAEILLSDISAEHYSFAGWYIGDEKITHIPTNNEGDLTITARWTPVEYTISYANTKSADNSNSGTYHIESENIVLQNLACEGYRFDGWYSENGKVTNIPTGSTGNIKLTAKWTACDYTITYVNTKGATNKNPDGFTTDSATITLSDLEKGGYTFDGWYNGDTKVTIIPTGTVGDITLTARWTPISYTATFTADGSVVATRYFTIEDGAISNIPNVPSKVGYTGAWSHYSLGTTNIIIPAVYTLNGYSITYENSKGAANKNPVTYTVEDMIILQDISADGYTFEGWYIGDEKITAMPVGSYGNKTLTAKWTPVTYSITYNDEKNLSHNNPATYTADSDTITLAPLCADGYTFDGWYSGSQKVTTIPAGSTGDLVLTAKWSVVSYKITYKNTKSATNGNPATYTIEDTINLSNISSSGYTFDGWYDGDTKVTQIVAGTFGDLTLTAKWTPIVYSFTFYGVDDAVNPNALTTTTIETWPGDYTLQDPSRSGYRFDGWVIQTKNGLMIPVTTINWSQIKGYSNNGTLYIRANWTELTIIKTAEDFANIVYDMSGNYVLANNIYISAPLGDETNPFTGSFYGDGYQISGSVAFDINNGTISGLNTVSCVCNTNNGTIENCSSQNGIAQINTGTIYRCKSSGLVSYSKAGDTFRGESYRYDTKTNQYYFDGYVTGYYQMYKYIGGLVANNTSTGVISQCEVTHTGKPPYEITQGNDYISVLFGYAGGFAGYSAGRITDCYYSGELLDVKCTNESYFVNSNSLSWNSDHTATAYMYCGGFIGYSSGDISGCFASVVSIEGKVNGRGWSAENKHYGAAYGYLGGFAGYAKTVSNSFCNVESISYDISNESSLCSYYRYIGASLADYYSTNKFETLYYSSGCSLSSYGIYGTRTIGTATNAANFKTRNFMVSTLGWSEDTWKFTNGNLPKLKWEQ